MHLQFYLKVKAAFQELHLLQLDWHANTANY